MSCLVSCLKPAFFGTVFFFPFCNLFDSKECLKVLDKRDKEALGYVEIWMVSIDKLTVDSQVLCFQFRRKITRTKYHATRVEKNYLTFRKQRS